MTNIFTDTSAFVALLDERDIDHDRALQVSRLIVEEGMVVITSDYVLDESFTTIFRHAGYSGAVTFNDELNKGRWSVIRIDESRFEQAKAIFLRFNRDKQWSFTDCTSYVIMKERKIKTAFSFDEHFREMGFKIL